MDKVKKIMTKVINKETILYVIFGVMTTIINVVLSALLHNMLNVEGNIASTCGIIVAVIFTYFTNRKMVFNSHAEGFKENLIEFFKFIVGRVFTMVMEIVGVFVLFSVIGVNYMISKLTMTVIVIIANFFISKFFSFK